MKCIQYREEKIVRVSDDRAFECVAYMGWKYVPKKLYKEQEGKPYKGK